MAYDYMRSYQGVNLAAVHSRILSINRRETRARRGKRVRGGSFPRFDW